MGSQPHRRRRQGRRAARAASARRSSTRTTRRVLLDLTELGRARRAAEGRRRRLRQRALQELDQPRAAPRRQGLARRGALDLAAPEADRRCRPGRPAQRRQVDVPRRASRARGRRSPTIPSPRCIRSSAWSQVDDDEFVHGRHPGPDRGRAAKAPASATASSAMSSAAPRSCIWSTRTEDDVVGD